MSVCIDKDYDVSPQIPGSRQYGCCSHRPAVGYFKSSKDQLIMCSEFFRIMGMIDA